MRKQQFKLGVTLMPLGGASESLDVVAELGLLGVQFDAADPNLRPRELSESARRDLASALRRRGLLATGIDCFIPIDRFTDAARVEVALVAVHGCIALAETLGRVPVSLHLPREADVAQDLQREAQRRGVALADFTLPVNMQSAQHIGIDPAAMLANDLDPCAVVAAVGVRVVAARLVDLLRSGMRGAIEEPGASRLDALAYRVALDIAGFRGLPVIDCRQWSDARAGVQATATRWSELLSADIGGSVS